MMDTDYLTELSALYEISSIPTSLISHEELGQLVLDKATRLLGTSVALLYRREEDGQPLRLWTGRGVPVAEVKDRSPQGEEIERTLHEGQPLILGRTEAVRALGLLPAHYSAPQGLCLPIRAGNSVRALLCVFRMTDRPFTHTELSLFNVLADRTGTALESVRLFAEAERRNCELRQEIAERKWAEDALKQRTEQLAVLYQIGQDITSSLDLDETLGRIVDDARQLTGARRSRILLVNPQARQVLKDMVSGYPPQWTETRDYERFEQGISGWVVREKRSALVPDVLADRRAGGRSQAASIRYGTKSLAVAPLIVRGEVIGTLTAVNLREDPVFTPEDMALVEQLAAQAAIAIENARLYEQVQQRAEELQAAYQQLQKAQEALVRAERLAAMSQIGVTVRHEINNPLTAVLGNAQWLLAMDPTLSAESREVLKEIETAAIRIRNVVHKLNEIEDRPVSYLGRTMMIDIHDDS